MFHTPGGHAMLLKQHILNDLGNYLNKPNHVVSEESIALMMHIFENEKCLINPSIVPFYQLDKHIKKIYDDKTPHSQLILEFNSRSLVTAKEPSHDGTLIHYAATDVFRNEADEIIIFVADHYFGKEYRLFSSEIELKFDFPVYFIIAGGSPYQNDNNHCPFFALQHLALSAKDTRLHTKLKKDIEQLKLSYPFKLDSNEVTERNANTLYFQINNKKLIYTFSDSSQLKKGTLKIKLQPVEWGNLTLDVLELYRSKIVYQFMQKENLLKPIKTPWFDLDPEYNVCTQSYTQINNYKKYISEKIGGKKSFNQTLSVFEHLIEQNSSYSALNNASEQTKKQNKSINAFAKECINAIKNYFASDTYNETKLIDICYAKRYCNIVELLNQEQQIRDAFKNMFPTLSTDKSLVDLIFSNQFILNCFTEKTLQNNNDKSVKSIMYFRDILSDSKIIILIQAGYVCSEHLLSKITSCKKNERLIDYNEVKNFSKKDWLLTWAITNLNFLNQLNPNDIIELLFSTISPELLKNTTVKNLYFSNQLTIRQLLAVKEPALEQLSQLNNNSIDTNKLKTQVITIIKGTSANSPTSISSIEDDVNHFRFFSSELSKVPNSKHNPEIKSSP